MLFNSWSFAVFFPVVTVLYFALRPAARPWLLLLGSAIFYAAFVPAYLLVLAWLIAVDYAAGLFMEGAPPPRKKAVLLASIVSNLGVLFAFKYYGFASANLTQAARVLGLEAALPALDVLLPIGLSFHTFQSLSYTIEIYRGRAPAERSLLLFALYVMFYPQLVAGPIERPQHLLPQLGRAHPLRHDDVADGLRLMAWGFFKKLVVADRVGVLVDHVYADPTRFGPVPLLAATVFFSYQIYCDFSGYSDIAIGAAQVMGIRLVTNFDRPYAAASLPEFWRRWHISLSTWFRDYVYLPLGGNRVGKMRLAANVMATFLLSGLWHGANWTFVAWGALHGVLVAGSMLTAQPRERLAHRLRLERHPRAWRALGVAFTFGAVTVAWVFFRARDLNQAFHVVGQLPAGLALVLGDPLGLPHRLAGLGLNRSEFVVALLAIGVLEAVQMLQGRLALRELAVRLPPFPRWAAYYATLLAILLYGHFDQSPFIYFQF